jgi:hypothetical protein
MSILLEPTFTTTTLQKFAPIMDCSGSGLPSPPDTETFGTSPKHPYGYNIWNDPMSLNILRPAKGYYQPSAGAGPSNWYVGAEPDTDQAAAGLSTSSAGAASSSAVAPETGPSSLSTTAGPSSSSESAPDTELEVSDVLAIDDPFESTSQNPRQMTRKEATQEYLEDLSRKIVDISLNQRDPSHPLMAKHMAPQFRGKHDALPKVNTRDAHQQSLKNHLSELKNFRCEIQNCSSECDDGRGRATVYIWYKLGGTEFGFTREGVAVFSWERKQGLWMIMKHQGMRGPSGLPN